MIIKPWYTVYRPHINSHVTCPRARVTISSVCEYVVRSNTALLLVKHRVIEFQREPARLAARIRSTVYKYLLRTGTPRYLAVPIGIWYRYWNTTGSRPVCKPKRSKCSQEDSR